MEGYFQPLAEMEANHFWFRSRNRLLVYAFQRSFPHAVNFLEVGSGNGICLSAIHEAFPALALVGTDVYPEGLRVARARVPSATFLQMDARRIPFDQEFDVAGAFDVIEHIDDDEGVLRQMRQAVKPGGGIIVTVPQHTFLWTSMDQAALHRRRYSRAGLMRAATNAGLAVAWVTSFVSLLLPAMLLSRRREYLAHEQVDVTKLLGINPFLNGVLEKVMDLERLFIRSGVLFPAGGSLLLVARRPAE